MPRHTRLLERAEDWLGQVAARALSRRGARYHAYHSNALDEDQLYAFGPAFARAPAELSAAFAVPAGDPVLLAVHVTARGLGSVRDPFVELHARSGQRVRQYVERGVLGVRYLNVSALSGEEHVTLHTSDLTVSANAEWIVQRQRDLPGPVLVVAPHPDDAELAAFGLYAQHEAWVVTACAGELGTHDYGGLFSADRAGSELRGKLRVAESLAAPVAGGVARERCANLGYFDGTLPAMFRAPGQPVASVGTGTSDLATFRAAGAPFRLPDRTHATWQGLVDDLSQLIRVSGARTLVFPHPVLDHHPDHACLGLAALEAAAASPGELDTYLAYAVHGPGGRVGASIHPVGMRDGAVSLPPGRFPAPLFDGLRSVSLDAALLRKKALALDTYRDLKDEEGPLPAEDARLRVRRGLREVYRALIVYDLGLLRRFLRPNELFFELDARALPEWRAHFEAYVRTSVAT